VGVLAMVAAFAFAGSAQASPTAFGAFRNNGTESSAAVSQAISNVPTNVGIVYDALGRTNTIQVYNFGTLLYTGPVDISLTLARIRNGGCITAEKDDGEFFNFTGNEFPNIPRKGNNYYIEFTVWFSINTNNATYDPSVEPYGSMSFPGSMRLLIGLGGEVYFTGDHYGEDGPQQNAYYVNPLPAPGAYRITSVAASTNDIRITWQTVGGSSNVVQATPGAGDGTYSNNFSDISSIIVPSAGDLTNVTYRDAGGATNAPSRYYRVRLVP
jgi:guanyl-specific ribonuclease Sa